MAETGAVSPAIPEAREKKKFFPGFSNTANTEPKQTPANGNKSDGSAASDLKKDQKKTERNNKKTGSAETKNETKETDPVSDKIKKQKIATSQILKYSWLNLITSCGLTLIYINIHIFGKKIFKLKSFSEPGAEILSSPLMANADELIKKEKSSLVKTFGFFEMAIVIFLDFAVILIFFLIILMAAMPFILTYAAWDALKTSIGALFNGIL